MHYKIRVVENKGFEICNHTYIYLEYVSAVLFFICFHHLKHNIIVNLTFFNLSSGKCQIIHWREVHKHECQQLDNNHSNSPKLALVNGFHGGISPDGRVDFQSLEYNINQPMLEETPSESTSYLPSLHLATTACAKVCTSGTPLMERRSMDKRPSHICSDKANMSGVSCSPLSCNIPVKELFTRHKVLILTFCVYVGCVLKITFTLGCSQEEVILC